MSSLFDEILRTLQDARTVCVASHLRPDADALGSTIACALWLRSMGKDVTAWNEEGTPAKFRYLPESGIVTLPEGRETAFDVLFALDTSVRNRLGSVTEKIAPGAFCINLDHHVSNERYGDINHIDPTSPATGQILFDLLEHAGAEVTPAMAANLYAAISTDTGSFQYAGTSGHTFRVAAKLVDLGVDVAALSRSMYDSQPRRRFELLRFALDRAEFHQQDRVATFSLTLADAARLGVLPEDNEGVIDHLRSVEGVDVAVFFEELPESRVRVSARSKNPSVDVCKLCALFGGGGHPMAAGARMRGRMEDVRKTFLDAVADEINKRN